IQNCALESAENLESILRESGIEIEENAAQEVASLKEFVSQARKLKAEHNLASKRDCTFYLAADQQQQAVVEKNSDKVKRLAGTQEIHFQKPEGTAPALVTPLGTLYLDLASSVDVEAEQARMDKELEQLAKQIASTEARLANEDFISKAPEKVVEGARKQLANLRAKQEEIERLKESLGAG
ncbi:MAG TPA: valine--tRNA ligase, partial [Opitutales bacterium]|nr:valine--tRNA ligase [Opitutales bacterium]